MMQKQVEVAEFQTSASHDCSTQLESPDPSSQPE